MQKQERSDSGLPNVCEGKKITEGVCPCGFTIKEINTDHWRPWRRGHAVRVYRDEALKRSQITNEVVSRVKKVAE